MVDIVTTETRSRMMSGIRSSNTAPEMQVRRLLFARGFRYRLHVRDLPGRPDIVLPRYRVVIFVHGCFWHRHDCHLFRPPATRTEFWQTKIHSNVERDKHHQAELIDSGWRVGVVWECALKGRTRLDVGWIGDTLADWVTGTRTTLLVKGRESSGSHL